MTSFIGVRLVAASVVAIVTMAWVSNCEAGGSVKWGGEPELLYDQRDQPGTTSTVSQDFESELDAYDCVLADDFIIPEGETWELWDVYVEGQYQHGSGPPRTFDVSFFANNDEDLPGSLVSSVKDCSYSDGFGLGDFFIDLPEVQLPAGAYWIAIQINQNEAEGRWGWADRILTTHSPAAWMNPGGGFGSCLTWYYRAAECNINMQAPDQLFVLIGVRDMTTAIDERTWGRIKATWK